MCSKESRLYSYNAFYCYMNINGERDGTNHMIISCKSEYEKKLFIWIMGSIHKENNYEHYLDIINHLVTNCMFCILQEVSVGHIYKDPLTSSMQHAKFLINKHDVLLNLRDYCMATPLVWAKALLNP